MRMMNNKEYLSIPDIKRIDGWKDIKIEISGAINECYVRESIAQMLEQASLKLPIGYKFIIWDTWLAKGIKFAQTAIYKFQNGSTWERI
jgi:hypothetical protein